MSLSCHRHHPLSGSVCNSYSSTGKGCCYLICSVFHSFYLDCCINCVTSFDNNNNNNKIIIVKRCTHKRTYRNVVTILKKESSWQLVCVSVHGSLSFLHKSVSTFTARNLSHRKFGSILGKPLAASSRR